MIFIADNDTIKFAVIFPILKTQKSAHAITILSVYPPYQLLNA
jgi:hypothetical protein